MTALIVIVCVLSYLMFAGASGTYLLNHARSKCLVWKAQQKAHAKGHLVPSYERCEAFFDHGWTFIAGIAWPLAAPLLIGALLGNFFSTGEERAERREKRRRDAHERKMAELQAENRMTMESIRVLVENGIQADVPGLYDIDAKGAN